MTLSRKFITLFEGSATAGTTTPRRATSGYLAGYLTFSGTNDLRLVVEGALGDDPYKYEPEESDWTIIQEANKDGFQVIRTIPTLMRFRVVQGTLHRAVGNFFVDAQLLPAPVHGATLSQVEGLVQQQLESVATLENLQERGGLNVMDYASHVVNGDWAPALNQMITDASPGDTITVPGGDYLIRSTWVINKPVHLECAQARLIATGDNFKPVLHAKPQGYVAPGFLDFRYWDIFEYQTPRPAIDIRTSVGDSGSIGHNGYFGEGNFFRTITGTLPMVDRVGNNALYKDGSVGVIANSIYYGRWSFSSVTGFTNGIVMDSRRTGTAPSGFGSSHNQVNLPNLRNLRNLVVIGRGPSAADPGWMTTNLFHKGGFASPDFDMSASGSENPPPEVVPNDHIHVVFIGRQSSHCYSNVLVDPYFEGFAVQAVLLVGPQTQNGVQIPGRGLGGFELKMPELRGKKSVQLAPSDGITSGPFACRFEGIMPKNIQGSPESYIAVYNNLAQHGETIGGITLLRDTRAGTSVNSAYGPSQVGINWEPLGPWSFEALTYNGAPLTIDASKSRRWLVEVNSDLAENALTITNAPAHVTEVEITLVQGPNVAVAPGWLKESRIYGSPIVPRKRAGGVDTYVFTNAQLLRVGYWLASKHVSDQAGTANLDVSNSSDVGGVETGVRINNAVGTLMGRLIVNSHDGAAQFIGFGVGGDSSKYFRGSGTGYFTAPNLTVADIFRLTPRTRANLPGAAQAGEGGLAVVSDPAAGKSRVVVSTGAIWEYLDRTPV